MKKIIVAVALACAAVFAQAASFDWSASRVYDSSGTLTSTTGYLVLTSDMARDDAVTAISKGNIASVTSAAKNSASFANGSMSASAANTFDYTIAAGESLSAFFVVVDGDKAFVSAVASAVAVETGSSTFVFGNQKTATQSAANWMSTGGEQAPEPTSGMLLLIGLAGLALRRKQA